MSEFAVDPQALAEGCYRLNEQWNSGERYRQLGALKQLAAALCQVPLRYHWQVFRLIEPELHADLLALAIIIGGNYRHIDYWMLQPEAPVVL